MKTIIRKSAAFLSFLFLALTSIAPAQAGTDMPVYLKANNPSIGITVDQADGAPYQIVNEKRRAVLSGIIKNNKTFYISTQSLSKGTYRFMIGQLQLQAFAIK